MAFMRRNNTSRTIKSAGKQYIPNLGKSKREKSKLGITGKLKKFK